MGADQPAQAWEFVPAPPHLAPGVTSIVGYRAIDVPDRVHLGLPSATLTFIVSLDDGVEGAATIDGLPGARPVPLLLSGLHVEASHVRLRSGQAGVQLAVHPLASRALFGVPAAELSVTDFDGAALLGRRAVDLHGRLTEAPDWRAALSMVAGYLVDAHGRRRGGSLRPELAHAWHLLERSHGGLTVAALADRVGLSERRLSTLFRAEVGRSPKTVARLMRFQHAVAQLAARVRHGKAVNLASVAASAGYYDQAHMTGDFVRFAGVPPRVWLGEEFRNLQDGGHGDWAGWQHDNSESDGLVDPASA